MRSIEVRIADTIVAMVTLNEIATLSGRKSQALRLLEKKGKFPPANYRMQNKRDGAGIEILRSGARIYRLETAIALAEVLKNEVKQGVKITPETTKKLFSLLKSELNHGKPVQ